MKEKNATSGFIKEIIKERGLSIKGVAEKIGYSQAMLSYMLCDQRTIKDTDILRIAEALGVTPNDLFGISSDFKMPVEITIKAEPEKIANLAAGIQSQRYNQNDNKLLKTAFEVICKFCENFGIDDIEISTLIDELKNEFSEKR